MTKQLWNRKEGTCKLTKEKSVRKESGGCRVRSRVKQVQKQTFFQTIDECILQSIFRCLSPCKRVSQRRYVMILPSLMTEATHLLPKNISPWVSMGSCACVIRVRVRVYNFIWTNTEIYKNSIFFPLFEYAEATTFDSYHVSKKNLWKK